MKKDESILEKFKAFKAVQETGAYNMFTPQARDLANEMHGDGDDNISKENWGYMMKNYAYLQSKS